MKKIILLSTDWERGYWESPKEAPYPKMRYTDFPEWDELHENLPLPGLGIYGHFKKQDLTREPFVYLQVNGMRYDENSGKPYFSTAPIAKSKTESARLINELPSQLRRLVSVIDAEKLVKIVSYIGETPPSEWKNLIESKEPLVSWRDYIGKYFLEIGTVSLSNNEFEDRIYALLNALGFNATQKGHILHGDYPGGIFSFEDYALVYDCKNTSNYVPSAADTRAIEKYLKDEKRMSKEKNIFHAFIAKSFGQESRGEVFNFTVSSLIYFLYKKLLLGPRFTLSPIKKILEDKVSLTIKNINNEWRA